MTDGWRLPPGLRGDPRLVRVGAGMVTDDNLLCPAHVSVKARPAVRPIARSRRPRSRLETFALGPMMSALDGIEFRGMSLDDALDESGKGSAAFHPGLRVFTEHAVRRYLAGLKWGFQPVPWVWVVQEDSEELWEFYAWGRRYESADQRVREFRFLRFGEAGARERPAVQVALAAFVTAFGRPASWPAAWEWAEPFRVRPETAGVEWVRVVEVGLVDGSTQVLFDGTASKAERLFETSGRSEVASVVNGTVRRPGASCADCKQLTTCGSVKRTPGILGVSSQRAPLRTVSVSDLRYYRSCPAQAHLRSLHLPRTDEYGAEAKLGKAVHAWLETVHAGDRPACCTPADMPAQGAEWSARPWHMSGETARLGQRMLAHHPEVCALSDPAISRVRVEPSLAFHDTAAQAIVIAKPDMLYMDDGAWVWREVKTTRKSTWFHDDLLDAFPQLALAVILLSEQALGGDPAASRVELEVLRPDGSDLFLIDPNDPERVAKARTVMQRLAGPWREDESFAARPGKHCRWCPVSQWCPSYVAVDVEDTEGSA